MSVITISRGSFTRGREVAVQVARQLGYQSIAREVLLAASEQFNVPEAQLVRAVAGSVSFLDRLTDGAQRYVAYIRAALLEALAADNVVYHGFAGHFFVAEVAHVLKVRVEADLEDRVHVVAERDSIAPDRARALIEGNDRERSTWSRRLYDIDARDPTLYDLVLRVGRLSVADAAELICHTVRLEQFHTTAASQQRLRDLALAARVQCVLAELTADVEVAAHGGEVTLRTLPQVASSASSIRHLERLAAGVAGVSSVKISGELPL